MNFIRIEKFKPRVFKNVVRGFSLVHDPKGSHYENLGDEEY